MEYLNFLADIYRVSPAERKARIDRYTEAFGIAAAVRNPIKSFSHGMRQKLVITGALIHEPMLWILDEPMVGLDPMAAHVLKEEMRAHCAKGNTVFFSTHVLEVAEKLCDRVGIIRNGELAAVGTLEELRAQAENGEILPGRHLPGYRKRGSVIHPMHQFGTLLKFQLRYKLGFRGIKRSARRHKVRENYRGRRRPAGSFCRCLHFNSVYLFAEYSI